MPVILLAVQWEDIKKYSQYTVNPDRDTTCDLAANADRIGAVRGIQLQTPAIPTFGILDFNPTTCAGNDGATFLAKVRISLVVPAD